MARWERRDARGEPSFLFYRHETADMMVAPEHLRPAMRLWIDRLHRRGDRCPVLPFVHPPILSLLPAANAARALWCLIDIAPAGVNVSA